MLRRIKMQGLVTVLLICCALVINVANMTCISEASEPEGDLYQTESAIDLYESAIDLYERALELERQKEYSKAIDLYSRALQIYLEEKDMELAALCSDGVQRLKIIQIEYPYTAEEIKDLIRQVYPQATPEQVDGWIKEMERYYWDGEDHYFSEAVSSLKYRHLELMRAEARIDQVYDLVSKINRIAQEKPEHPWMQYQKPVTYRGTHTISIPREKLPKTGTYRIWLPIPINNGPQTQVTIESVVPEKWVKQPPGIDQDIGLLYMEVPMEELTEDLFIKVVFTFTHYEQRFSVNPDNVGEYDKESELYKRYTQSYANTEITPDISETARKIVGNETNPYLAARKIYDYIVHNVDYSFMLHFAMFPRTSQTETDYVHKHRRGDCGAQSMYFTALWRSLGIPARTTGGWQLFYGDFNSHFWAEFYLPNYGWIPVDTSFAQIALYPENLTEEQRQLFIDYCFGNQGSMRCVVQKDTDLTLIPPSKYAVMFSMVIQLPTIEYSIPNGEIPEDLFLQYWTMDCEIVD